MSINGIILLMKQDGLIVEVMAKAKLLEHGLLVSQPIDPKSRYDLIADNGKKLLKVQVKGLNSNRFSNKFSFRLYTKTKRLATDNVRRPYTKDEVDMFVVYLEPFDVWYVIPQDVVDGKSEVTLFPESTKSMYDVYKDAWYLFNE